MQGNATFILIPAGIPLIPCLKSIELEIISINKIKRKSKQDWTLK